MIDVSDPKAPVLKSLWKTGDEARDVVVRGSVAFVAAGAAGLLAVDVRDPAGAAPAGSWDSPGEALGLAVSGDIAYLADGSAGLQIVDVANPPNGRPFSAPSIPTGRPKAWPLSGRTPSSPTVRAGSRSSTWARPRRPSRPRPWPLPDTPTAFRSRASFSAWATSTTAGTRSWTSPVRLPPSVVSTNKYTMYNESWRVVLKGGRAVRRRLFFGDFLRRPVRSRPSPVERIVFHSELDRGRGRRGAARLRRRRAVRPPGRRRRGPGPPRSPRRDGDLPGRPEPGRGRPFRLSSRTAGRFGFSTSPIRPSPSRSARWPFRRACRGRSLCGERTRI